MGSVNFGVQNHTFDYNQEATAKSFNVINHDLLPIGIYDGFTLTKQSNTYVQVSTGTCFIQDPVAGISTRISTTTSVSIPITSATPYLIFRFEWADIRNNYMDMLAVAYEDILDSDIIVGRCEYNTSGTEMYPVFDYSRRRVQYLNKVRVEKDYLKTLPTEPQSKSVQVTSGILNSSKGNLLVSGRVLDPLPDTTNGRIDLIYVDENGTIKTLLGTDSSSPVAVRYGNRKVVAEIRRGPLRTSIRGTEIFPVISSFDSASITSDQLITDNGSLYASANVEDALQEIAGSAFTFKGLKIFTKLASFLEGLVVKGVSGSNIATFKKYNSETPVCYINQNGKLINNVGAEIAMVDKYGKFTTGRYEEALNQIAGEAMSIAGVKTFSSSPIVPTPSGGDNSTKVATTAFVKNQGYATLASPALTGTPTAPTPATSLNSTQIATTAFVKNQKYAPVNNPTFTGTVTAPTLVGNADTATLAADATKLKTARTIGGVSFNGSANINLPGVNTPGNQNTSGNAATASKASKANVRVSLRHSNTFFAKTWPGITSFNGSNIWTDGDNIYYSGGTEQFVLNKATSTWVAKTWIGLTYFSGSRIWTDGENIYYSDGSQQFVLNKATSTWVAKTWTGLTGFFSSYIWTDGENIYYSGGPNQVVLNKATSTWTKKTWTGLTGFFGSNIWTDGDNIYYSGGTEQFVLNKATSTWVTKTWPGITSFNGSNIWTDGENIYYSDGSQQFVLNKATSTWVAKTWTGLIGFSSSYIWTDGENIYYSGGNATNQFVLPATRHNYVDDNKYNSLFGTVTTCSCSTLSDRFVFSNE